MTDQRARRVALSDPIDASATASLVAAAQQLVLDGAAGRGALAELARHLPLSLVRITPDRRISEVFGRAFERPGMTGDLFLGPIAAWGDDAVAAAERALSGHTTRFDIEGEVGGTRFLYRAILFPADDGGALGVAIDTTDELSAHDAVADQAELLRASIHALDTAIVVQDEQGRVLSYNPALGALLGVDLAGDAGAGAGAAEILGQRPDELLAQVTHENGAPFAAADFPGRVALRTGEAQRNVTMRVTRFDGEVRVLQVSCFPIRLSGRSVVLTSLTDVSHRSATESILRDSDDRFRLVADAAPIGIFVAAPDGASLYVNPQGELNCGRSAEEIRSTAWHDFVHPDDRRALAIEQQRGLDEADGFIAEYRLVRPDGSTPWVRSRGKRIFDEDGETIGIVGTVADITEMREAVDRLREREERTRAILESAAEGIVGCLESGVIVEFNASAERMFGYDSTEVLGRMNVLDLLADGDRDLLASWFRDYVRGAPARLTGQGPREVVGRHQDGSDVPLEITITEVQTSEGRLFTGVIRDLSEQKAFERELEHRATHDAVTDLPNRILFNVQLDAALARARKHRSAVAVLSVLVDRVSLVAASLGHEAADTLLIEAASRITKAIEPSPSPARVAHDQFVVILDESETEIGNVAVEVATRIIDAIRQPFLLGEDEALATAHIGIAMSPIGGAAAPDLIADAGVAMRRAAESGPVDYEIFDPDMRALVDARRRDEIALRHGLERDEFELYYQPIFDLASGEVRGAEALIRWHRPDEALVLPGSFIPLAEESGLIIELGAWVVRRACEQVATWQRELGPACPAVSINLSGRQLAHPDLIDTIRRAIIGTGADPARLAFEITETVLLDDVDRAVATLEALHDIGVRLSLDDFGTGYSSLTYLCRFPIDIVKIDRSFVSEGRNINEPIVNMILGLAGTLALDVIAEGVETELQAETLRLVGCPAAQGFLFARPAPAADLTALLRSSNR